VQSGANQGLAFLAVGRQKLTISIGQVWGGTTSPVHGPAGAVVPR